MSKEQFYDFVVFVVLLVFVAILTALTFVVFYIFESMFMRGVLVFTFFFTCGCVFIEISEILER